VSRRSCGGSAGRVQLLGRATFVIFYLFGRHKCPPTRPCNPHVRAQPWLHCLWTPSHCFPFLRCLHHCSSWGCDSLHEFTTTINFCNGHACTRPGVESCPLSVLLCIRPLMNSACSHVVPDISIETQRGVLLMLQRILGHPPFLLPSLPPSLTPHLSLSQLQIIRACQSMHPLMNPACSHWDPSP
jgi:hypothetical protein